MSLFVTQDNNGFRQVETIPYSESQLNAWLEPLGFSTRQPQKLAEAILKLSDWYNSQPEPLTSWQNPSVQAAYLAYFLPLNMARLRAVYFEGEQLGFFKPYKRWVDIGSGPATLLHALPQVSATIELVESHKNAQSLAQNTLPGRKLNWTQTISGTPQSLAVLSYVLGETPSLAEVMASFGAIMILEPSTREAAPRFQKMRSALLAQGFHLWAPCPHQELCPLRQLNEKIVDWCHDRVAVTTPPWFANIEKFLPIKNRTVTFSYLLAAKTPPPAMSFGRLVGDALIEKGKTRQLLCQGSEKIYLRWLKRTKFKGELSRGAKIKPVLLSGHPEIDATDEQMRAFSFEVNDSEG